jgi:hypothetical protein
MHGTGAHGARIMGCILWNRCIAELVEPLLWAAFWNSFFAFVLSCYMIWNYKEDEI